VKVARLLGLWLGGSLATLGLTPTAYGQTDPAEAARPSDDLDWHPSQSPVPGKPANGRAPGETMRPLAPTPTASPVAPVPGLLIATPGDPPRRPLVSGYLMFGAAFGGTEIVEAQLSNGEGRTLATGRGYGLSLGALLMPLWFEDRIGLGVRLEAGFKRDSIDVSEGDSLALNRFPVLALVSTLTRVSGSLFILAEGGIDKDTGIDLSPSALRQMLPDSFHSSLGVVGQAGIFFHETSNLGLDLYLRYVHLSYQVAAHSLDASSVGAYLGFHVILPPSS